MLNAHIGSPLGCTAEVHTSQIGFLLSARDVEKRMAETLRQCLGRKQVGLNNNDEIFFFLRPATYYQVDLTGGAFQMYLSGLPDSEWLNIRYQY
jgi:hypothetical protein